MIHIILQNRKRLGYLKNKLKSIVGGRDSQEIGDRCVHTAILKIDNQQGPTVQDRELHPMLCGSLDGEGV